jgi:hypothetical protein
MQSDAESPSLINAIRIAVEQVEQSGDVALDDPAMVELRHNVARTVGELEIAKAKRLERVES